MKNSNLNVGSGEIKITQVNKLSPIFCPFAIMYIFVAYSFKGNMEDVSLSKTMEHYVV